MKFITIMITNETTIAAPKLILHLQSSYRSPSRRPWEVPTQRITRERGLG